MRFLNDGKKHTKKGFILPLAAFLVVFAFFCYAVDSMSSGTDSREKEVLEQAVNDSVIYCYSMEGSYPENVAYLEENYGLTYDKDKYYIGYRMQGSNIKPDITIIDMSGQDAETVPGLGETSARVNGGVS